MILKDAFDSTGLAACADARLVSNHGKPTTTNGCDRSALPFRERLAHWLGTAVYAQRFVGHLFHPCCIHLVFRRAHQAVARR